MPKYLQRSLWALIAILAIGLCLPEQATIPVQNASRKDWNANSFWFEPWGASGVHKGIDIFAKEGSPVLAATAGLRVWQGDLGMGGNVVAILGPKWRIHYYAHLQTPAHANLFIAKGNPIARVGTSGNAAGKPPHLHYSTLSLIPLPWRIDRSSQGWKKMFFLNPQDSLP